MEQFNIAHGGKVKRKGSVSEFMAAMGSRSGVRGPQGE